jgi:hypothetical protein
MRGWLVVVAVTCACKREPSVQPAGARGGSSEAEFAAQLAAALPERSLTFDAASHALRGSNAFFSTTNVYQEWLRIDPADRADAIKRLAASMSSLDTDTPKTATEVHDKLRPAVRAVSYFDPAQLKKLGSGAGSAVDTTTIPYVMIGEGAAAAVAIDRDDSTAIATNKDLADWKLSIDQALAIGTANLRTTGAHFEQLEPGLWTAKTGDSYDASRILLVDDIAALGLSGGAVAMIPNRETLLLAGAKDPKALLAMAAHAEAVAGAPRPIHTAPLCLNGRAWRDCIPDATAEVQQRFELLAAQGWISLYDDDHDAYQKQLGDDGLFVAHLKGTHQPGGKTITFTTWTKTVPTALPKAGYIAFVVLEGDAGHEKGRSLGIAPWDRVMRVVGSHLKETGHMPHYWGTGDYFPTHAELEQLALTLDP